MVNSQLRSTDIGTFLEQMLLENLIPFKYSDKTFKHSLLWLQAKHLAAEATQYMPPLPAPASDEEFKRQNFTFCNEFALVYYNSITFQEDFKEGALAKTMA